MTNILSSLRQAIKILFSDKVILISGIVPVLLGLAFYGLFGGLIYNSVFVEGREWIESTIGTGGFGTFLKILVGGLLTLILFVVMNLTFVIVVSAVASPFNDVISGRTEKALNGFAGADGEGGSFSHMFKALWQTLKNEAKKILFIFIFTIFAFFLSLIPFLAPISIIIYALLLSVQFLDYSWSRHNLKVSLCFKDIRSSMLTYILSGALFLFIMSVPLVNLLSLPVAVIYFTILFVEKQKSSLPVEAAN